MSKFDSRHPLVSLIDEVSRLQGRLRSVFGEAREQLGLGGSESMVLNAVVEAQRAPTAAQIGRSLGYPRQVVQRAANKLLDHGLIETQPNPDHKRAVLLCPTADGIALKRQADAMADRLAQSLCSDESAARDATRALRAVREDIETQFRNRKG